MTKKKQDFLNRIINPHTKHTVIIPMDHGVSDGPLQGLDTIRATLEKVKLGGADAVVLHKGLVKGHAFVLQGFPYLIHISASSSLGAPLRKVLVATPRECRNLGASGVSIHINLGNEYEPQMLFDLGKISRECEDEDMPLLAMMYVRRMEGGKVVDDKSVSSVAHAARIAYELGADIVKVNYTGDAQGFKQVVGGTQIPIVVAGGSKQSEDQFLQMISESLEAGASGVSCGRNVFQAEDATSTVKRIVSLVHGGA